MRAFAELGSVRTAGVLGAGGCTVIPCSPWLAFRWAGGGICDKELVAAVDPWLPDPCAVYIQRLDGRAGAWQLARWIRWAAPRVNLTAICLRTGNPVVAGWALCRGMKETLTEENGDVRYLATGDEVSRFIRAMGGRVSCTTGSD